VLVEREIGDDPFQPIVFVLELPEPARRTSSFRLEHGLAHPQLPADAPTGVPASDLAQA
jgi:hypothetical protein